MNNGKTTNTNNYSSWLLKELEIWQSYHNHKETMAWVATAAFVTGIVYFGTLIASDSKWQASLHTLLVIILFCLAFTFIKMQFERRWRAADIVHAMRRLLKRSPDGKFEEEKVQLKEEDTEQLPNFVYASLHAIQKETPREFKKNLLIAYVVSRSTLDNRWKTELTSYSFLVIASILSIFFIWGRLIALPR